MATFNMTFLSRDKPIKMTFGSVVEHEIYISDDPYEGPYIATPATKRQYFHTKHKDMMDDFTVREIPYAETSNEHGTTVVIAS